jgi:hypothetical protein
VFCAYECISIRGKWMDDLQKYQRRSMIIADLHLDISPRARPKIKVDVENVQCLWKMLRPTNQSSTRTRVLLPVEKPSKGK